MQKEVVKKNWMWELTERVAQPRSKQRDEVGKGGRAGERFRAAFLPNTFYVANQK